MAMLQSWDCSCGIMHPQWCAIIVDVFHEQNWGEKGGIYYADGWAFGFYRSVDEVKELAQRLGIPMRWLDGKKGGWIEGYKPSP